MQRYKYKYVLLHFLLYKTGQNVNLSQKKIKSNTLKVLIKNKNNNFVVSIVIPKRILKSHEYQIF